MFEATALSNLWEWCQPDPESIAYFSRDAADGYVRYDMLAIRTGKKGAKEDELGPLTLAPNYGSDWVIWRDWLAMTGCPVPKLDDYFVDADGNGWSVTAHNVKLRQQYVELTNCCSMNAPYPAGV